MKNIYLYLIVVALLSSCSSFTKRGNSHTARNFNADPGVEEPAVEEEDDDDASDLAASGEETPEDLGEVDGSQNRQASEIEADRLASRTFPLVQNEFVDQWIRYFSGRGRDFFERWLARSTRYIPLMKQVLRKEGVPEDLIYLAMIESGFNTKAKSHAKAVGPWQFIKGTGDRYNLKVSYWIDERRDFIKSTYAAAKYLKELNQIFGSWYLAAASYNAGEGKVLMAVRRDRSRNFWELIRIKQNFRAETRNYVPKMIAAALVSKNPKNYGFENIAFEEPFQWETVSVPGGVRLKQIASIIGQEEELVDLLNPALRRGMTPPGSNYDLRIPVGTQQILVTRMSELKTHSRAFFAIHRVRRGESLGSIARRYRADVQEIMDLNNIKRVTRLKVGQELSIPQSEGGSKRAEQRRGRKNPFVKATESSSIETQSARLMEGDQYKVQNGDTLWDLSRRFNVSVDELKRANNIRNKRDFRAGIMITIPKKGTGAGSMRRSRNTRAR